MCLRVSACVSVSLCASVCVSVCLDVRICMRLGVSPVFTATSKSALHMGSAAVSPAFL